jgi:hypothetical protein
MGGQFQNSRRLIRKSQRFYQEYQEQKFRDLTYPGKSGVN